MKPDPRRDAVMHATGSDAAFAGLDISELATGIEKNGHVQPEVADRLLGHGYNQALIEKAERIGLRARLAEDQRRLLLVRVRQVGLERVAKALATDVAALALIRESQSARPSQLLAQLLERLTLQSQ